MRASEAHRYRGALLAIGAAALFGASTPFAKLLLISTDELLLAGLLYLGSGVGLAIVSVIGRVRVGSRSEAPLRLADLPWLAGIVLFGGILGPAFPYRGWR